MLNINVSDPKSLERAIRSVSKFADTRRHNRRQSTQQILVQSTEKELRLTATDLYASIELSVNSSEVISEGEFCIKAPHLLKLGEIVKDQSAIGLEQSETGVNLTLSDAPAFRAKFKTSETDEFPMTAQPDPKAHSIELDPEHLAIVKAVMKYASMEKYRVGFDAVQFAMDSETLFVYTTDSKALAHAELGRTETELPNFALPVDALKKAFQVANAPDLKNFDWRITLPTEENNIVTIQIADTAVKFRAGDTNDLTDDILRHESYQGEDDDLVIFESKALVNGMKKVAKLFVKDKQVEDVVVIAGNQDGNITMTVKAYKKSSFSRTLADMSAEYIHAFTETEARCVTSANHFQIGVDGKKFQSMIKDLMVSKPKNISVQAKCADKTDENAPNPDSIVISAFNSPLGFLTSPEKL